MKSQLTLLLASLLLYSCASNNIKLKHNAPPLTFSHSQCMMINLDNKSSEITTSLISAIQKTKYTPVMIKTNRERLIDSITSTPPLPSQGNLTLKTNSITDVKIDSTKNPTQYLAITNIDYIITKPSGEILSAGTTNGQGTAWDSNSLDEIPTRSAINQSIKNATADITQLFTQRSVIKSFPPPKVSDAPLFEKLSTLAKEENFSALKQAIHDIDKSSLSIQDVSAINAYESIAEFNLGNIPQASIIASRLDANYSELSSYIIHSLNDYNNLKKYESTPIGAQCK